MSSEKMRQARGIKRSFGAQLGDAADVELAGLGIEANLARVAGQVAEAAGFGYFAGVLVDGGRAGRRGWGGVGSGYGGGRSGGGFGGFGGGCHNEKG